MKQILTLDNPWERRFGEAVSATGKLKIMPRYVVQNTPHTSCPNAWMVLDTKLGMPATANDKPQIDLTLDEALDISAELNYADRGRLTTTVH